MRITWCRAVSWLQAVGTLKGVAKTFAGNLLTLSCHQGVHVILSSVEKKLRFLMKKFQDFYHIMEWAPNGSRSK